MKSRSRPVSRRSFLSAVGATIAAPLVIPSSALGLDGAVSPSERITFGIIGCGNRGSDDLNHFLLQKDIQWLGICDAREERRTAGKAIVDRKYGNTDCATFADFREMLARPDYDAVLIATGCHWHALLSIYAAKAGKDIYCEKPCTLHLAEGQALVNTMARYGTVYQAGHQRRSVDSFRFVAEVVRNGMIGQIKEVIMQVWENPVLRPQRPQPVPPGFDYDMWLGWTPWHPYTETRCRGWAYFWDTGGGMMLDMGCHWTDMAQFVLQRDHVLPVEFEGEAQFDPDAFSETPIRGEWRATYSDGVKLIMAQRGGFDDRYIRFVGTEGWIQVHDGTNAVTTSNPAILRLRSISAKGWGDVGDHVSNLLTCIKTRNPMTTCHPESAHRATALGHLGNIAIRLGRKLRVDPDTGHITNDVEADRMLSRALRPPWHL